MAELLSFGPMELEALRLSLTIALRSVAFSLPPALLVAWLLTRRRFPGRTLFDAFVHLPLVLPPVLVGYLLLVLFGIRGPSARGCTRCSTFVSCSRPQAQRWRPQRCRFR